MSRISFLKTPLTWLIICWGVCLNYGLTYLDLCLMRRSSKLKSTLKKHSMMFLDSSKLIISLLSIFCKYYERGKTVGHDFAVFFTNYWIMPICSIVYNCSVQIGRKGISSHTNIPIIIHLYHLIPYTFIQILFNLSQSSSSPTLSSLTSWMLATGWQSNQPASRKILLRPWQTYPRPHMLSIF